MSENNMSEINSIEELRIYADTFGFETRSKLNEIADNIELELAKNYAKLPVDADDVPIKPDDAIGWDDGDKMEIAYMCWYGGDDWMACSGEEYDNTDNFEECVHVKRYAQFHDDAMNIATKIRDDNIGYDGVVIDCTMDVLRDGIVKAVKLK